MEKEEVEKFLKHSEKPVRQLAEWALSVLGSPYYTGYLTMKKQLDTWAEELKASPVGIISKEDDDMKAFDKAHKFLDKMDEFYDKLAYFKTKLSPDELKQVESTSEVDEVRKALKRDASRN